MSAIALELDHFHLTSPLDKMGLSVSTTVDVLFPEDLAPEINQQNINVLESGMLWVVRNPFCSMDFFLTFDQILDVGQRVYICESLAYHIRDAHLWSQLLISPILAITQQDDPTHRKPDFSLRLGHPKPPPGPILLSKGWLAGNVDLKPPESVPCVTIQRLQIRLKFQSVQNKPRPASKRVKVKRDRKQEEPEFLETSSEVIPGANLEALEGIVAHLSHSLSQSVARHFGFFEPDDTSLDPILLDESTIDFNPANLENSLEETHRFEDTLLLSSDLNFDQRDVECADDEMLLLPDQLVEPEVHHDEAGNEMLFTSVTDRPPSIVSQPSPSYIFLKQSFTSSLKRSVSSEATTISSSQTEQSLSVTMPAAHKLIEAALHMLLSGYTSKRCRSLGNLTVSRPLPETSLARLAPGIFSPGYREVIASNAHFLPIISLAVSFSWPRNVQSPSLKRKLVDLARRSTPGEATAEGSSQDDHLIPRLLKTVQCRLWSMMQRKLYNHSATNSLRWKADEKCTEISDEAADMDLLRSNTTGDINQGGTEMKFFDLNGEQHGDYMSEFEDLLDENDDESEMLSLDSTEREQIQTKQDTNKMLFGRECNDNQDAQDDDATLLSNHGISPENMLII